MIYTGEYLNEISFPIGGIGTGCFGIAGNGRFVDWEIFNKPAKGKSLGFSHIAVRARRKDGQFIVKILNGDLTKDLTGVYDKGTFHGFGFGPSSGTMSGLPHFKNVEFNGEFPIAKLTFWDDDFPGKVILTAFNPFIPLDSKNSSLPAAFFDINFVNDGETDVEYEAFMSISNPFNQSVNKQLETDEKKILQVTTSLDDKDIDYGDISIISDCENTHIQQYWYRGSWCDNLEVYINDLHNDIHLKNRIYDTFGKMDTATIQASANINNPHIRFVLCWNIPNNHNYWSKKESAPWKNYYATQFKSSADTAIYCINNFDSLYSRTLDFKNALFSSSLDSCIIDAIASTMSVLKTATVLRLEDGSFYGWEGVNELEGSCEGTCQHVWNYAYALCFLFPDLERSIRDNEFKYCMYENGKTVFRMSLPMGSDKLDMRACLDGQMGTIIKTYREWKISGNTEWLKSVWNDVKTILAYAWSDANEDKWDADKDGVLEGRQHHTLDMELFGPSAWLEGIYLCALKAACEMAKFLNDTVAWSEYNDLFEKGKKWTNINLFNGKYFMQKINLKDKSPTEKFNCPNYWYDEGEELKYQIGDGCEIDQLLGQWHSDILGLGEIFDSEQTDIALKSLYTENFKLMRDINNTWRIFSLNDEKGAIICSFPQGKPAIPIPYNTETMTGFEYALAGLMIKHGFEQEGLSIIKAIRNRYDGKKRNPYNEIECGSNYARAMAAYALLPIYSGFKFDLPNKAIGFDPIHKENFQSFFSTGTAWGVFSQTNDKSSITIKEGYLNLNKFMTNTEPQSVLIDDKKIDFIYDNGIVSFDEMIIKDKIIFTNCTK